MTKTRTLPHSLQKKLSASLFQHTLLSPSIVSDMRTAGVFEKLRERFVAFVEESVMSDWVQTYMDQLIADAPKFCPHDPNYDENALPTKYDNRPFPYLSLTTIDLVFFSAVFIAEVAFIMFLESHVDLAERSDPLSAQNSFIAVDDELFD